mmetsp:Transcript_80851/g.261818  ORF Transcript_80851/g.261818 Transcript_80851/m.261818 type:complete len:325 (+) Transcript_80851:130-1104(+)
MLGHHLLQQRHLQVVLRELGQHLEQVAEAPLVLRQGLVGPAPVLRQAARADEGLALLEPASLRMGAAAASATAALAAAGRWPAAVVALVQRWRRHRRPVAVPGLEYRCRPTPRGRRGGCTQGPRQRTAWGWRRWLRNGTALRHRQPVAPSHGPGCSGTLRGVGLCLRVEEGPSPRTRRSCSRPSRRTVQPRCSWCRQCRCCTWWAGAPVARRRGVRRGQAVPGTLRTRLVLSLRRRLRRGCSGHRRIGSDALRPSPPRVRVPGSDAAPARRLQARRQGARGAAARSLQGRQAGALPVQGIPRLAPGGLDLCQDVASGIGQATDP